MPNQEDILQAAMQRFVENRDEKFIRDVEREQKYRCLDAELTVARQECDEMREWIRKLLRWNNDRVSYEELCDVISELAAQAKKWLKETK